MAYTVDCPKCGDGLYYLGEGKPKTFTCPSCGYTAKLYSPIPSTTPR